MFTIVKYGLFTFVNMRSQAFLQTVFDNYSSIKNPNLWGRYITEKDIEPQLKEISSYFTIEEIGNTVLKNPVHSVTFGNGPVRILGWSQMHGNESTTTKAVFDLFNLFSLQNGISNSDSLQDILNKCTIKIIPLLNPDGAARYTRVNLNEVDLNRDAYRVEEEESKILRRTFEAFEPHFCLNLHDQRTIFSAGNEKKPATLSFLAPSLDEERSISGNREKAMQLIVAMNNDLQKFIPGQIGRYDDAFNMNCTGDFFQSAGVPTILFEAGHFQNDYMREKTREFTALSILSCVQHISSGEFEQCETQDYFSIPENEKKFFDVILRDVSLDDKKVDVAIQFEEKIKAGKISFEPVIQEIEENLSFYGHQEIDCQGERISIFPEGEIKENVVVNQILLKNNRLSIKST